MWVKQTDSLVKTNSNSVSVRFKCPQCNTLNTFKDIVIPEFSDNYEKATESDETEVDERECTNIKCKCVFEISVTNGAGGFIIQVPDVADSDIEYEL